MNKSLALIAIAAMLTLTACSSGDASSSEAPTTDAAPATASAPSMVSAEQTEEQNPRPLPAGKFFMNTPEGQKIEFDLPVLASDPRVAEIEAYRKDVGARPISYIVADLDNRKGTSHLKMYGVNAFDEDGHKYEFVSADDFIDEWKPSYTADYDYVLPDGSKLSDEEGTALYNRGIELGNKHRHRIDLSERGPQFLVSVETDIPKEFTRVSVNPDTGPAEIGNAYPEGWDTPTEAFDGTTEESMTFDECMDQYAQVTAEQSGMTVDEVMKDEEFVELCRATTTAESMSQ